MITPHHQLNYSIFYQYKKMERIFQKHWGILLEDPMLKSSNTVPKITYRKTRTIKSLIAPSKLKTIHNRPTPSRTFLTLNGMYQCKKQKCLTCKFVSLPKIFATKGNTYQFREFFNCSSDFVIYGIRCLCDLLYIGRTIQTLRKRFGEHRRSIK